MIAQNMQEATHTCFSVAQKRVYSLMENNSYPRFLESEFYQELCKKTSISRAAQGTWEMERREKQPLGWWGSQATAREQHPDPKGWGTEHPDCMAQCKDKYWLWCRADGPEWHCWRVLRGDGRIVPASCWHCPSLPVLQREVAVQEPVCCGQGVMWQVRTELPSCEQKLFSALGHCWELE